MRINGEEDMKYNIGDKVFDVGMIQYFTNIYHYKQKQSAAISIVTKADDKHFTIYKDFKFDNWSGCNSFRRFSQETGLSYSYPNPKKLLHCIKDKTEIENLIKYVLDKEFKFVEKEIEFQKKRTENRIKGLEEILKRLNNNVISITCMTEDAISYLQEREAEAYNLLKNN